MQTPSNTVGQKIASSYTEAVQIKLTTLLYERFLLLALLNSILVLIVSILLWDQVVPNILLIWNVCSLFGLSIIPLACRFSFQREKLTFEHLKKWQILLIFLYCLQGCVWSFTSLLFFDTTEIVVHSSLTFITIITAVIYANHITGSKTIFYFFIVPVLLATSFRLALENNLALQLIELACLILIFTVIIFYSKLHSIFIKTLILNEQKTKQAKIFQQASSNKSQFLASISHDLKQPLQAHRLHIADLKRNVTDTDSKKIIQNLELSTNAMSEMFTTLLDIAKLDSGVIKPDIQHFKIAELFDDIIIDFSALALDKDLCLKVVDSSIILKSDCLLLKRIIRNLVSNAIKYTNSGGILIGCRRKSNSHVSIEVWDTGIGIPVNQIKTIFDEYNQLNNPNQECHKGIGLGLAIVNRLALLLNHDITIKSIVNQGSVFSARIPIGNINKVL